MRRINELTEIYSLDKVLRFELKPIGKTLENIEKKGLIAQDEKRAEEYKEMKGIIDEYHKAFIKMCLEGLTLRMENLQEYVSLAESPNRNEADFDKIKETLRKQIVEAFKNGGSYADLFKKELIQKHLPYFVTKDKERQLVDNFCKFTTYFRGFHKNRENMYSDEAKSTAIAYRIIHENLPMFLDNVHSFRWIRESEVSQRFGDIETAFFRRSQRKSTGRYVSARLFQRCLDARANRCLQQNNRWQDIG